MKNNNNNTNTKYKIAVAWLGVVIAILTALSILMTVLAIQYSGRLSKIEERFDNICALSYDPSTCKVGMEYLLGE